MTYGGLTMPYRLYVPDHLEAGKQYPLVLFLHGGSERGNDNEAQLLAYDGALVWTEQEKPCFVLAPQSPDDGPGWLEVTKRMTAMLRAAGKEDLRVTIYPAGEYWGHGSWEPTYRNQEMIAWLFHQRKKA